MERRRTKVNFRYLHSTQQTRDGWGRQRCNTLSPIKLSLCPILLWMAWTAALGDNLTVHMNRPIGWTLSSQYINKPPDSLSEGIKVYAAAIPR